MADNDIITHARVLHSANYFAAFGSTNCSPHIG